MELAVQVRDKLDRMVVGVWPLGPEVTPWAVGVTSAIFCVLNLFMVGGPILATRLHGKYSSPACLPFAGPFLLTLWVRATHRPWWAIPLVWCCDAGTILVLVSIPVLASHWWKTSSHTQILGLHATIGKQRATLTIHSTGRYHLEKYWNREPGEPGAVRAGQLGNVSELNGSYLLKPDYGGSKKLELQADGSFQIVEEQLTEMTRNLALADWHFERDT